MADDRYRRADPDGVIARFTSSAPIARSAEGTYLAWLHSLRDGLDPTAAATIVLTAGACGASGATDRRLRRLLELTCGTQRTAVNDNIRDEEV